jgi:hypothetical protein
MAKTSETYTPMPDEITPRRLHRINSRLGWRRHRPRRAASRAEAPWSRALRCCCRPVGRSGVEIIGRRGQAGINMHANAAGPNNPIAH